MTLPEGVELSPSAANGLEGCSEAQVGFAGFNAATQTKEFNTRQPACPDGSKVGTVRIKTPLLCHELEGGCVSGLPGAERRSGEEPVRLAGGAVHSRGRSGVGRACEARG